jgi:hypothetical protein
MSIVSTLSTVIAISLLLYLYAFEKSMFRKLDCVHITARINILIWTTAITASTSCALATISKQGSCRPSESFLHHRTFWIWRLQQRL